MAKLLGSADATLVGAAGKAAMAGVSKDLCGIQERIAKSYAKGAEAWAEMWGEAIKVVGDIGSDLINIDFICEFESKK